MGQIAMPLAEPVDAAVVQRLPDMLSAINLAITVAGLDPKQAYMELGIDKSHWSRIQSGQLSFPTDKLGDLCDFVGNDIPLQWWAFRRGKGVHLLESEQQRIIRAKDDEISKLKAENDLLRELLLGRRQ